MAAQQEEVWNMSLDSCATQKERHRELVFENLSTNKPKKVSLVLKDSILGSIYKIPLGKVKPQAKGTGSRKENVIVPVVPMNYTTPDHDKFEALPVRKGWIYVFRKGHLWRELEVIERNYMRDVNLTHYQNKDRRPATCEVDTRIALPHKIGGEDQKVEIAFSEVQWSWDYINALGGMAKDDPRLKAGTKLASENNEQYAKGSRETRLTKVTNLGEYSNLFSASPSQAEINSVKTFSDTFHKKIHLPSELGAVFLPDPIGVSRKLALQHENAWAELNELVESLRTGVEPDSNNGVSLKKPQPVKPQTEHEKEIAAQFDVLSLMYGVSYATKEGREKMGENMNKNLFITYLAVKERKKLREKIKESRKKLVEYLNKDEYQHSLSDFINNTPERQIEGKGWVCLTLRMLSTPIHALDVQLDLPEEIKVDKNDPGIEYTKKAFGGYNYAGAVLAATAKVTPKIQSRLPSGFSDQQILGIMNEPAVPITTKLLAALDNKGMDILTRVSAISTALVDGLASLTIKDTAMLDNLVHRINTIQLPGFPEFKINQQNYATLKLPNGYELVSEKTFRLKKTMPARAYVPTSAPVAVVSGNYGVILKGRIVQVVPAQVHTHETYVKQIVQFDVPSKSTQSVVARNIRSSKLYRRGFGGFLILLEVINIKSAVKQTAEANKLQLGALKSNINWVGTIAGTGATLAYVTELYAKSVSKKALAASIAIAGKVLSKVAIVPAALLTAWDASENFDEGDTDAGIAYSIAAIATAATLFVTPVGVAVLLGIAIAALITAWFLEDDPLERFSKNGPMNEDIKIAKGGSLWEKLKSSARNTGVEKKFRKWQTWRSVRQEMFDYFQAFEIKMRVNRKAMRINPDLNRDGKITTGERIKATWANSQITSLVAQTVDVSLKPRDFHTFLSEIDFYCRYYPSGIGKGDKKELVLIDMKPDVDSKTNKVKKIDFTFGLPDKINPQDYEFAEIIFCARMRQTQQVKNYVPVPTESGEARFIAVKRRANSLRSNQAGGFSADDNPDWAMGRGVDTLKNLETQEHWKKK